MRASDDREFGEEFFEQDQGHEESPVAVPGQLTPAPWLCAACGRRNETLADLGGGYKQQYVEDCAICCRPNVITLVIDEKSLRIALRNELEYE